MTETRPIDVDAADARRAAEQRKRKRLGVVLAAGDATRLPNKLLLPVRGGGLLIEEAIQFVGRHCGDVVVVVNPTGIVEAALTHVRRYRELRFIVQHHADGVPDAIARAMESSRFLRESPGFPEEYERVIVAFGDNRYPLDNTRCPMEDERVNSAATVIALIRDSERCRELDWCEGGDVCEPDRWHDRWDVCDGDAKLVLAGYWSLRPCDARLGVPHEPAVGFLNRIEAAAVSWMPSRWGDLGTPSAYLAHLRGDLLEEELPQ